MSCSQWSKLKYYSYLSKYFVREFSSRPFNDRYFPFKLRSLRQHLKYKEIVTNLRNIHSNAENKSSFDIDQDLHEFNNAYELVRKSLLYTDDKAIIEALDWSSKVLDYNVQGGKKNRGVTVLKACKILFKKELTSDGVLQACLLGWCVEMLQGFFVVLDDIMDNSLTRRGKPCWYQKTDVRLVAINDALLLEHGIYKILEMYFEKSKAYSDILKEFLRVSRKTVYGQTLDMLNVPPNQKPRFENFSLENYCAIVEYKTSHYSFCLPVHLAMHLNGRFSKKDFEATRNICLKLGLLFQIQDDYLDIYGNPEVTGKVGTDIIDGKCSWFATYVFDHAPADMKQIMMENYGVNDPDCVSRVLTLYEEMNLAEEFHAVEQTLENEIKTLMDHTLSSDSLRELFQFLLQKIRRRDK